MKMFTNDELKLIRQIFSQLKWQTGQSNLALMAESIINKINVVVNNGANIPKPVKKEE